MSNPYEAYEDAYEEDWNEASDEAFDEAAPRRRPSPAPFRPQSRPTVPVPNLRPPQPAAAMGQYVTREQLKTVTDKVAAAFKVTNDAVGKIGSRTQRLAREQERLDAGLRKELTERKKEICAVRKDLQSTREMSALLPMLTNLAGPNNQLSTFAPLLLLGNDVSCDAAQGNSGGLLGGLGGNSTLSLVAILAMTGALNKQV